MMYMLLMATCNTVCNTNVILHFSLDLPVPLQTSRRATQVYGCVLKEGPPATNIGYVLQY